MKKLVCLLTTALLCLALFSCTDKPEVTPDETKTPEATETPNETATPNEQEVTTPDTPETVTPTEPEVVEPEVTEPVTPEADEPEENVVMLPEADENTIKYTLEFPEDFIFGSYTDLYEPQNIVDFDEFDFGNNALRIEYSLPNYPYETSLRLFTAVAYVGNGIHSLEEGKEAYNRYWGIEEQPYYDIYNQEPPFVVEPVAEVKKINYAIPGSDRMCELDKVRNYNNSLKVFDRVKDVVENGKILPRTEFIYSFYSSDMTRMLYEITVPFDFVEDENESAGMDILQILDEKHILVQLSYGKSGYGASFCTYILDLESNIWHRILPFAFNAVFSPDGKYFAYTPLGFYDLTIEIYWDERDRIYSGYYVKEMETGKTVYYHNEKAISLPFDWISADVLKQKAES